MQRTSWVDKWAGPSVMCPYSYNTVKIRFIVDVTDRRYF